MSLEEFNIQKGETIYLILRHVSKSRMTRDISLLILRPDNYYKILDISHAALEFLNKHGYTHYKFGKDGASIRTTGCGMEMGFEIVYNISKLMFGDGYALKHQWL